jgi:hypothetical protein
MPGSPLALNFKLTDVHKAEGSDGGVSVWQQKEEWGMEEEDENIHGSELLDMF